MKLNRKVKLTKEPKREEKVTKKNTLPSDSYKPLFKPMEILLREVPSQQDPSSMVKQYLEIKAIRFGDDGLPYVFCTMRQESEYYTGYLKGKSIYFPLEMLYSVMELFDQFSEKCDNEGIAD